MLSINYRDSRPIYMQVKDGFRNLIIAGVIRAGDKMPSVRELSAELAINPNTIQRAYRELENEGYIYSVPGKGSFAGERHEIDEGRKQALLKQLDDAVAELGYIGMSREDICGRIMKGEEV